jgi:hypothetical protein
MRCIDPRRKSKEKRDMKRIILRLPHLRHLRLTAMLAQNNAAKSRITQMNAGLSPV